MDEDTQSRTTSVLKFVLVVFNVFFWLSGCAVLGIGVWLKVDPRLINLGEVIKIGNTANDSLDETASVVDIVAFIFIAAGVFVFLVGFCGCCGAIKESRWFLGVYIFCLVFIFALEFGGGLYAVLRRMEISDKIKEHGKLWVERKYTFDETKVDKAFNFVMLNFECCGMGDYLDFKNSTYLEKKQTPVHKGKALPMSYACCKTDHSAVDLLGSSVDAAPMNASLCRQEAYTLFFEQNNNGPFNHFNQGGCHQELAEWLEQNLLIIALVGCCIAAVELLGFILALLLWLRVGVKN